MHDSGYLSAAYFIESEAFQIKMDAVGKATGAAYGAKFLGGRTCLGTNVRTLEWQLSEDKAPRMQSDLDDVGFDVTLRVLA